MNLYIVLCPCCGRGFNPSAIGRPCPVCQPDPNVKGEPEIEWRRAGEFIEGTLP